MPHKFAKVISNNKERDSADLNPYSSLVSSDVVKNKIFTNKLFSKTEHNNYFMVLQINGQDIWKENADTQIRLIDNFARILDSFKHKISIIKLDEQIKYDKNKEYINNSSKNKQLLNKNNEFWSKYYQANIDDFSKLETENTASVFYLVINAPTIDSLEEMYITFEQKINDLGLFTYNKLQDFELLKFLNQLNRFGKSDEEIHSYLNLSGIYNQKNSLDQLFAYDEVIFNRDTISINGNQYSVKCVGKTANRLNAQWLKQMFTISGTIVWNLFPYNDQNAINKLLDKAAKRNEDSMNVDHTIVGKFSSSIEERAILAMIEQVQQENYKLFDANIFVFDTVKDRQEQRAANIKLKNTWAKENFGTNSLLFRQFEGFLDVINFPITKLDREYYQITSLNQAVGYPIHRKLLNDGNSLLVGKELRESDEALVWNMFKLTQYRTNHNVMILGTPGMGKSTFTKKILTNAVSAGNIAIVIDPQAEYIKWANTLGGQIIDLGSGSGTTINPLQVRSFIARSEDEVDKANIKSIVNNHLNWLNKFFSIVFDNLYSKKSAILRQQIINLYEKWGIYKLNRVSDFTYEEWPTMSDLIKSMREYEIPEDHHDREQRQKEILDFAELLSIEFENNSNLRELYNGHTTVSINNDVVVFKNDNLTDTQGSITARLGIMVLLSLINEFIFNNALNNKIIIKEYKQENNVKILSMKEMQKLIKYSALCIDEEHLYINEKNITTLEYIADTTKLVRKLDCGTIHTTQNPSDYKQTASVAEMASRIINNCSYSFFFGLLDNDIETVKGFYKNSNQLLDSEVKFIASRQRGKVLATISNNERYSINLHFNDVEKELFFDKGE
nr:DUF87 domain-containing protein [Mycoplasmopsis bovis]